MIYFDNAATSKFKPQNAIRAMLSAAMNSANAGRGGHNESISAYSLIINARETLKRFLGAGNDYEIIFTSNCTEALNMAILGALAHEDNPHVITTVYEHNSVLRPLKSLKNAEITYLTPDQINAEYIEKLIKINTKLVIINHISNVTGSKQDIDSIGKICAAYGVPLLVDGAQSLGHVTMNAENSNISMLAGAGHKGLYGVQGVGFLLVNKNIRLSHIKYGGTGTDSAELIQPDAIPEGYEYGTLNLCGIAALAESVKWTEDNFNMLFNHYNTLSSHIHHTLKQWEEMELYSEYPSSVISFNIKGYSSSEVADFLNSKGIAVRSGLHCAPLIHRYLGTLERGAVRVSLGYNNNLYDVNALIIALREAIKQA